MTAKEFVLMVHPSAGALPMSRYSAGTREIFITKFPPSRLPEDVLGISMAEAMHSEDSAWLSAATSMLRFDGYGKHFMVCGRIDAPGKTLRQFVFKEGVVIKGFVESDIRLYSNFHNWANAIGLSDDEAVAVFSVGHIERFGFVDFGTEENLKRVADAGFEKLKGIEIPDLSLWIVKVLGQ